jgi:probable HAF family extracellular repeat protein
MLSRGGKVSVMTRTLRSLFVRVLLLASVVLVAVGAVSIRPAIAQESYVVEDLGALPGDASSVAQAINARGDVVGWSNGPNGTRAFVYTDAGGMVALPGLPDRPRAVARDINDVGDIVGSANAGGVDPGHAVLWRGGSVEDLGTLATGSYSEAWGINNFGQVVGSSNIDGGSFGVHAFLYTAADGMVDLTPTRDTGHAKDINDAGQVTGYFTAFGGYHAFRWQAGSTEDMGVLPGMAHSFGWAINASGRVAGSSSSATGSTERFFRSLDGGGLQDLGGVGEHNAALGVNATGEVVGAAGQSGSRAVRYTDEAGLQDLNTLIDPSLGWVLLAATDINDAGQIVGYAHNNHTGQTHAVRLQPTTTPPPACSFQCLQSTSIALRAKYARRAYTVKGTVRVNDEHGSAVAGAMVVGRWTQPDGGQRDEYAWTDANGLAALSTRGGSGTYTLTVIDMYLSQYLFDPAHSVLSRSITVAR